MKLFLTVGSLLPFDRLVSNVDIWAANHPEVELYAQIGKSTYKPSSCEFSKLLSPAEYTNRIEWCDALVSHAGMGSIITALQFGKPILLLPRKANLKEHRNDHQLATAKRFQELSSIRVALNERELDGELSRLIDAQSDSTLSAYASEELLTSIRQFIFK